MRFNLLLIILVTIGSTAFSKTLTTAQSEIILVEGKILNKKGAIDPLSENPTKMFTFYEVVHKGHFYICYTGVWPRGRNIDKLVEGVKVRCTGVE